MKLKIRDGHARLNSDKTEYEMPSGSLDIIGEGGGTLFYLSVTNGELEVSAVSNIKVNKVILGNQIAVRARSSNVIRVFRLPYE